MRTSTSDIIQRIQRGETLESIAFSFLSPSQLELLKRCATVRSFDKQLFDQVFRVGLNNVAGESIPFKQLINHPAIERLPRSETLYRMKDGARQEYFKQWWQTPTADHPILVDEIPAALREFSDRLVTFYEDSGPEGQLNTLYHLIAADPTKAAPLFKDLYDEADDDFDRVLCYDLLNVLEQRLPILGPKLSALYNNYLLYYRARGVWINEYYQSAHYFERRTLRNKLETLLKRDKQWILSVYGRGGMGKTMFVRWLIARRCTADQSDYYPCARIDFDNVEAIKLAEEPLLLCLKIAEQLNNQIKDAPFYELINELQEYQTILNRQAWTRDGGAGTLSAVAAKQKTVAQFSDRFVAALNESSLKNPVVIIFDTLEKIVGHHRTVVMPLLDQIAALHDRYPGLRLVLSGRSNLEEKLPELTKTYRNEIFIYELKKFDHDEASGYLKHKRNLKSRNPIEAIVEKARGNPFKLTLFADLAKANPALDTKTVMAFQSSTIADLIFRVIEAVRNPGVRWLLRYGVVPRELSLTFLRDVLAPALEKAMSGVASTAGTVDIDEVWTALCHYASKHAWVSFVVGKTDTLKFHDEVVTSLRRELQTDDTFIQLQQSAFAYFERKAAQGPEKWGTWIQEAIYHRFQVEGPAAGAYWRSQVDSDNARHNPHWRLMLAKEILGPDYLDEEERVRELRKKTPVIDMKTLVQAYFEKARALVEIANVPFSASRISIWNEADADCRWVELLQKAFAEPIIQPAQMAVLHGKILVNQQKYEEARQVLDKAVVTEPDHDERLELEIEYGDLESVLRNDLKAVEHYRAALDLLEQQAKPSIKFLMRVHRKLGQTYFNLNSFLSAAKEFQAGFDLANKQEDAASVLKFSQRLIETNLVMGRLDEALAYADDKHTELQETDELIVNIRRFRHCLTVSAVWMALQNPIRALELCSKTLQMEPFFERQVAEEKLALRELKELRAARRELFGKVLYHLMSYREALEELDQARVLWAEIGDSEAANRCFSQMIDIWLRKIGNSIHAYTLFDYSDRYLDKSVERDSISETWIRLQLLRADWLYRTDREEDAHNLIEQLIARSENDWTARMVVILTLEVASQQGFQPLQNYALFFRKLEHLEPASARISFPGLLRRCPRIGGLPKELARSIEELLPELDPKRLDYESHALSLAETFRVLGNETRADEWLTKAEVDLKRTENLFPLLQIVGTSRRMGREMDSVGRTAALVKNFLLAYEAYPTLCGALLLEYAECLYLGNKHEESSSTLRKASKYLYQEKPTTLSRLMVRVERLQKLLAEKKGDFKAAEVHAERGRNYLQQLIGNTEFYREIVRDEFRVSERATTTTSVPPEEADNIEQIAGDSLNAFQRDFVMDFHTARQMAAVLQVRLEENKLSARLQLPSEEVREWRKKPLETQDPDDLPLGSGDPFAQEFLNRLLSNCKQTMKKMGDLLVTPEEANTIWGLTKKQPVDLRLEIADEAMASLPWEMMQFPGQMDLLCCSDNLRYFYRAPFVTTTVDVRELKWVQQMLKRLMPAKAKNLIADGVDGEETKRVVLAFQRKQKLYDDGRAGPVTIKVLKQVLRDKQIITPRRALILQASVEREQEVYRGDRRQGLDLANLYSSNGFSVDMLENPSVENLKESLRSHAPDIVHICATMKNSPSVGVYLDFASDLSVKNESLSAGDNNAFTFSALSDQLKILSDRDELRPIVILDIARPPGISEILRQLLLRNTYASGLIRLGGISAIVATGLGTLADELNLNQLLIKQAAAGEPIGFVVKQIRKLALQVPSMSDENDVTAENLESIVSFLGTALFTTNPFY